MRRWPTWLLVGALVALGSLAVADALRGHGEKTSVESTTPSVTAPVRLERSSLAMSGVLYYSDSAGECRIHGLSLPDLGTAPAPKLSSCDFSLSPDGHTALRGDAAWQPQGGLYASATGDEIDLESPVSAQALHLAGRAPAFKPSGTFTYVRGGSVVEWTIRCPPGSGLFTLPGDTATSRCRHEVLRRADFRQAFPRQPVLAVNDLAWLSETRLAAVVLIRAGFSPREAITIFEGRELVAVGLGEFGEGLHVRASPSGAYLSAWYGHTLYTLLDRDGDRLVFPPLTAVRALAWSPDERWTAAATGRSIYFFRTDEGEARVRRLPIQANDLAWR